MNIHLFHLSSAVIGFHLEAQYKHVLVVLIAKTSTVRFSDLKLFQCSATFPPLTVHSGAVRERLLSVIGGTVESQCDAVTQYQVTKCCLVRRLELAAKTPGRGYSWQHFLQHFCIKNKSERTMVI